MISVAKSIGITASLALASAGIAVNANPGQSSAPTACSQGADCVLPLRGAEAVAETVEEASGFPILAVLGAVAAIGAIVAVVADDDDEDDAVSA
jgi:hypothetical protein